MLGLSRNFQIYTSAAFLFLFLAISLTPITAPLPPYTGEYEVGILDLETEVESRTIHDAVLKETGEKAFELQTLAVTLYYPSSLPPLPVQPWARPWLPQPISLIGTGYARLIGLRWAPLQSVITFFLWALGSGTVIPGVVDAPILSSTFPPSSNQGKVIDEVGKSRKFKDEEHLELKRDAKLGPGPALGKKLEKMGVVVFTHGMAGMSQSYSHYLGSIASHGYMVAAVEHRDGSGPGSIVQSPDADGKKRKGKFVWHLELDDLISNPPMTSEELKAAQLNFREAEIQETIRLFDRLNQGSHSEITNLKPNSPESALAGFKDRLNMSAVTVAGHSYGATGALQALKNAPNNAMPINGAIMLDPGKGSGPLNDRIELPTLVMQSGEWTEKQVEFYGQGQHFDVVRKLVEKTKIGWFMTLKGSAHPSCTDAPLIVPWIMKLATKTTLEGRVALREYIHASVSFLEYLKHGKKGGMLRQEVTSVDGPLGDAEKRGSVKGAFGAEWEVHVVPSK